MYKIKISFDTGCFVKTFYWKEYNNFNSAINVMLSDYSINISQYISAYSPLS